MSVIYAIINIVNDKHYVGQAVDKVLRFREHKKTLKGNYHCNKYIQRSWDKYGSENFIFVVLEICPHEIINQREQYWIDILNTVQPNGYNMAPVAGSMLNYKHTDEAKANMAKAQFGSKQSEETKLKKSISLKGNKNAAGVKQTPERIEARAVLFRGKPKSAEQRAKMSAAQKGRVHSDETKKKMMEAAKRRWNTA